MKPLDIYARFSRQGKRESTTSIADQVKDARAFAKSRNLPLSGEVFEDPDKSGGTLDRPELQKALRRVETGESGGIIVAYQSRATRDTAQGLELLERITRAGGTVYAPNMPDYTTADGKMLTTINLAIDTAYRERKREEFERAKRGAIEAGIPVSNRARVGYRKVDDKSDPRHRHLAIDPRTGPVITEIFRMRARGKGPAAIADYLYAHGVTTSQGSATWSKSAVYDVLKSRIYLGELSYGTPPRYVNPAAHESLIDLATWEAAQRLDKPTLAPFRGTPGRHLLTGLLRCAACRYSLHGTTTGRGVRVYRCQRRHAAGICPAPAWVRADDVEAAGLAAFWEIAQDVEMCATANGRADAIGHLERDHEAAERAYVQWRDDSEAADEDYSEYRLRLRVLRERRADTAQALGHARAEQDEEIFPLVSKLREDWENIDAPSRRELVAARIDCIAVARGDEGCALTIYASGEGPADLPRRGFKHAPELRPFDVPRGARVLTL